eukprot:Sspe_Gene.106173::Locus_83402_Transcript_1_2_Confidence_0.667_Length_3358::g.106173::m.106173
MGDIRRTASNRSFRRGSITGYAPSSARAPYGYNDDLLAPSDGINVHRLDSGMYDSLASSHMPPGLPPPAPALTVSVRSSRRRRMSVDSMHLGGAPAVASPPQISGTANELFSPHGKPFDSLPAFRNLKIRSMLKAVRCHLIAGRKFTDMEWEHQMRWCEVTKEMYGEDVTTKVNALLRLGFAPSVLRGLKEIIEGLEEAMEDPEHMQRGRVFSMGVTQVEKLLGLKAESAELLMTTRSMGGPRRIMENVSMGQSVLGETPRTEVTQADDEEGSRLKLGSRGKPVVTYSELLDNIIVFTPLSSDDDRLDLLFEMFDSGKGKDEEYIRSDDVLRMLQWVKKEADYSNTHAKCVDVVFQRVCEDYIKVMRIENELEDADQVVHPDDHIRNCIEKDGFHRFVLQQIFLSSETGHRVRFRKGDQVIAQNVRSQELNGRHGEVVGPDPRHRGQLIVSFPPPLEERHLHPTNLRFVPGSAPDRERLAKDTDWGLYLPLSLNIRPRADCEPHYPPSEGWRAVLDWLIGHLTLFFFITTIIVLFGIPLYFRYYKRVEIRRMFGAGAAISGACGWVLRWIAIVTIASGCHTTIRLFPKWMQPDPARLPWIHMVLAGIMCFFGLAHIAAASDVLHTITQQDPARVDSVLGTSWSESRTSISSADVVNTIPGATGISMCAVLVVMALCTCAERDSWIFYLGHKLYLALVVLFMIHPLAGWFEWKYGSIVWLSPAIALVLFDLILNWALRKPQVADEVVCLKGHRGTVIGVEFRVKRTKGMVQQQAGEYVEIQAPEVNRQWLPATITSAPELKDDTVHIQVVSRVRTEWLKTAEEKAQRQDGSISQVHIRGPFGLAASDVLKGPQAGGSGKLILAASSEGLFHLSAVLNDLSISLERPNDMARAKVSRLHPVISDFVQKQAQFEVLVVASCRSLEGNLRFQEAVLRCLRLNEHTTKEGTGGVEAAPGDEVMEPMIAIQIHLTHYASQGLGVEAWHRLSKLGANIKEGIKDERIASMIGKCVDYGTPDWETILRRCRYRWLGCKVDVLHWGDAADADHIARMCRDHSFDPHRPGLRPDDSTTFKFHHGRTPAAAQRREG